MNIRKAIAKEGIILLVFVALGLVVYFVSRHLNSAYLAQHHEAQFKVIGNMKYSLVGYTPYMRTMALGLNIAIFGYPVIACIRFVFWAVKTLKEK